MERLGKVLVIKAVCKCIDVSDVKVLMIKALRRCTDVSNVRELDAAWGKFLRGAV